MSEPCTGGKTKRQKLLKRRHVNEKAGERESDTCEQPAHLPSSLWRWRYPPWPQEWGGGCGSGQSTWTGTLLETHIKEKTKITGNSPFSGRNKAQNEQHADGKGQKQTFGGVSQHCDAALTRKQPLLTQQGQLQQTNETLDYKLSGISFFDWSIW